MSAGCCTNEVRFEGLSTAYRRVLWIVIALNAAMFAAEMTAGFAAGSMALRADALDFLGDSLTYGLSLAVIGRSLRARARAALVKGASLGLLGVWVLGATMVEALGPAVPHAPTIGVVGMAALAVNVGSALMLMRWRNGDANVRSVWLCSRNDAVGNVAVIAAGGLVALTGTAWPDLAVAAAMAGIFLHSSWRILGQARAELEEARQAVSA